MILKCSLHRAPGPRASGPPGVRFPVRDLQLDGVAKQGERER